LTLFQNLANPVLNIPSAGNPALEPVRPNNLELAQEKYFSPTTSLLFDGLCKKGGWFSARVAYNWRDDFLSGVANVVGVGSIPIYTESYG
jgi:hypothetical protein